MNRSAGGAREEDSERPSFGKADGIDDLSSIEGTVARDTVRVGSLFAAVATLLFSGLYTLRGPSALVLPNLLASILFALIAAIRTRDATVSVYSAVTTALLLFGYQLMLVGRIDNGISVWLLAPNVAAIILGMRNLARYCAAVTFAEIVGVVVGARVGWFPADRVVIPEPDIVMAATMFAVLILCGLFALITTRARQRLTAELTARNRDLAAALDETRLARNEALEASLAKDRFFANLTHEIRTPLNGIAGTTELLEQTELSVEQRPLAKALAVSTSSLIELVNTMLDHAKIAAGHAKIEHAPLNLVGLTQELLSMFGARAAEKGLSFKMVLAEGSPVWVDTDGLKIKQIVGNLVVNAIKFTARGTVDVRLHCTRTAGAAERTRLTVEVADTGIGITPEHLAAVFEPFVQGDATITRVHGGTGLGLTIARQLAELLGGSLRVVSVPGEGSTFTLELPVLIVDAPQQTLETKIPEASNLSGLRVLLVEDNLVNQLVAKAMLKRLVAEVDVANNGSEAVRMAFEREYHVILMDLQMPGMDGITAAGEIRARERVANKPPVAIVAMTGNSPDDYGEACRRAGMVGFLVKPVTLEQLTRVLTQSGSSGR